MDTLGLVCLYTSVALVLATLLDEIAYDLVQWQNLCRRTEATYSLEYPEY